MNRELSWIVYLILISIILVGCSSPPPEPTSLPRTQEPELAVQATSTATEAQPEPSPTATDPPQPELVVLLASPASDPDLADRLTGELEPRLTELGLHWETKTSLDPAGLMGVRLVIALPPDPGLASLAAAAPDTQFLALGISGLATAANLSLVGSEGPPADQLGFTAGVIAAMITPDWRVGVLGPSEPIQALHARLGFLNGAIFFCGLCLPYHGPTNVDYPVYWDLPEGAGVEAIQAALQGLGDQAVTTVYLPPGVLDARLAEALAQTGLLVLGSGAPPPELADQWVASILADPLPGVLDILSDILEGKGGHSLESDIVLLNINPQLFSSGRQQHVLEILAEMQAGFIDPGIDLLEP